MVLQNSLIVSGYNRFFNINILNILLTELQSTDDKQKKSTYIHAFCHPHRTVFISTKHWVLPGDMLKSSKYLLFNTMYSLLCDIFILSRFVIFNTLTKKDALSQLFQYSDTSQINNMIAFMRNQNNQFQLPPDWILWVEQN